MRSGDRLRIVEADWIWTGREFEPNLQMEISVDGRIISIHERTESPDLKLLDAAVLPGMVNAHSHAFQRGLRGRAEVFSEGAGSFWTWRQEMYDLVNSLDAELFYRLSLRAFKEMLRCGITSVGEFHYLHHSSEEEDYGLDEVLLEAAGDAGIRLVLIHVYYRWGGVDRDLSGAQLRFRTSSLSGYWKQLEALDRRVASRPSQTVGVAAHSIRAVRPDELIRLHERAFSEGRIFHMHLEEQLEELEASREAYGSTPIGCLMERIDFDRCFTAIHATHTSRDDLHHVLGHGGNVCVCPTTEGNLGDGIAGLEGLDPVRWCLCVGTDSNSRISITEELRWLEYLQRARRRQRGVFVDDQGSLARGLLLAGTRNGARALGLNVGAFDAGNWADLVAIDLRAESLAGWEPETLLASYLLGADASAVRGVMVGGRWTSFPDEARSGL